MTEPIKLNSTPYDGEHDRLIAAELIALEIKWCEENPDKAFSAEYRKGFINGLIQARYILGNMQEIRQGEE